MYPHIVLHWLLRLQEDLAACTAKKTASVIAGEMTEMTRWALECQAQHNRECSLDVKYLQARYAKGVSKVESWMSMNHRYMELESMDIAPAEVLKVMSSTTPGNDGILG